jgi:hypothetical protein
VLREGQVDAPARGGEVSRLLPLVAARAAATGVGRAECVLTTPRLQHEQGQEGLDTLSWRTPTSYVTIASLRPIAHVYVFISIHGAKDTIQ